MHNGATLVIKTVETSTRFAKVYNFAVAQNANYFVGKDGVLVHNGGKYRPGKCKVWHQGGRQQVDIQFPTRKAAKDATSKKGLWSNQPEKHRRGERHFHDKNHDDLSKPNYHYSFPD